MGQIATKTEKLQSGFPDHVETTIHMTTDGSTPMEVEIQIEVDGYPIAWGNINHNFVRVFESGRFRSEWKVLQSFLKPEYFTEIETIINQWRNADNK